MFTNSQNNAAPLLPLVVILGPTASGKSALAISLAESLNAEILVCDSTQIYRHFDIGTAKVPIEAQRNIPHHLVDLIEPQRNIPHHLVDLIEPHEIFTAGDYRRRAEEVLADLRLRKKLPIVVAGTGLYLRALLEGLSEAPTRSEDLRERLRRKSTQHGPEHLHRVLARLDPETAARIAPRDTPKIIRAIEMRILVGKSVGEIHGAGRAPLEGYDVKKIGLLPLREALYARIDARVGSMLAAGWLDEVRQLIARGVPADAKPFQFIGYSQLRAHLEGRLTLADAVAQIQQATRRFAKRQLTWFRKEPNVTWLNKFGDDPTATSVALESLR